ncbi:uncharacterized protein LOC108740159 [Agrilus planipennis]|uniref:Uncharacterized protein LOC108740159 n=1 Tax=Agrilus planipennis TaxID=224129 RepID=A0A1W4X164_AGRPL|nr:uncharacterized protein LOC108740159 [Agrilus planipennis]
MNTDSDSWEPLSMCSRSVTRSKYERMNPESQKWWKRMFEIMEEKLKIPPEKRPEVISQIYPKKLLERILDIVESKPDLKIEAKKYYLAQSSASLYSSEGVKHFGKGESCTSFVVGQYIIKSEVPKETEEEEEEEESEEMLKEGQQEEEEEDKEGPKRYERRETEQTVEVLKVESWEETVSSLPCKYHAPRSIEIDDKKHEVIGEENPYVNFFKRREERAAVWRILPPLSLDEMNLAQKAKYLVNQIATEFIDWLEREGGTEMIHLDVPTLLYMFQFSFEIGHAANSLQVRMREMPSVTEPVARATKNLKASERNTLLRNIREDIRMSKLPPKQRAFNSSLPIQMRRKPNTEDLYNKWFVCKHVPPKLADMTIVWEGITHLRSVREFEKWINEKYPDLIVPGLEQTKQQEQRIAYSE